MPTIMNSVMVRLLIALCPLAVALSSTDSNVTSSQNNTTTSQIDDGDVMCSLCQEDEYVPQDPLARFVASGDLAITCENAYRLGQLSMPVENCTFLQDWGRTLCRCGAPTPPSTTQRRCTLCEDGSNVPNPLLAGLKDEPCAVLEVDAKRDDPSVCSVWQATVGTYCGCVNRKASRDACRICGENTALPDPYKMIDSNINVEDGDTCGEMEFEANLPDSNCKAFQHAYSSKCCYRHAQPILHEITSRAAGHMHHEHFDKLFLAHVAVIFSVVHLMQLL